MNELGLDITSLTRPGRKPAPAEIGARRELELSDLQRLEEPAAGPDPTEVRRMTERHHALARALAEGMTPGVAGSMLGFSPSRVSILRSSPAFKELQDLYTREKDAQFVETTARLAGLTQDAILELQQRLEDEPGEITTAQLVEIAKMAADRSGHGPSSKNETTVRVDLADRLEAARQRALEARGPVIDHED